MILSRATALRLANQGAKVVVADMSAAHVQEVVKLIGEASALPAIVDVCDEDSVRQHMEQVTIIIRLSQLLYFMVLLFRHVIAGGV